MNLNEIEISQKWEKVIKDITIGNLPVLETMDAASKDFLHQDHFDFIQRCRTFETLISNEQIFFRVNHEIIEENRKKDPNFKPIKTGKIEKAIQYKDGYRRLKKLGAIQREVFSDMPPLLNGSSFEECLTQYLKIIDYVEGLWADACNLYHRNHYPLATFTAILTIEEIGKVERIWDDLFKYDRPRTFSKLQSDPFIRDHRKKHFISVVSGAVANIRLDKILGIKQIRKLLEDAECGKIEELRQSCLYLDIINGKVVRPAEKVGLDTARFFTVLAGELIHQILGHFPWDCERMLGAAIRFEETIGFDPELVKSDQKLYL